MSESGGFDKQGGQDRQVGRQSIEGERRIPDGRQLQSVLDTIDAVVWLGGADALPPLFVNAAAESLYGRPLAEIIADAEFWPRCIHPQDLVAAVQDRDRGLRESGYAGLRYRLVRPDGTVVRVFDRTWAIAAGGHLHPSAARKIGIISDITEQHNTERELVAEKKAAQRTVRLRSSFIANMSHEIRTPLNAVLGFSELITREATDTRVVGFAQHVLKAGRALGVLLEDLIDLSQIDAGKIQLQLQWCNVDELIHDLESLFAARASAKGLDFAVIAAADLPRRLFIDRKRIRQVLISLIDNALRYTTGGFVRVEFGEADATDGHDTRLYFDVTDSGAGISESERSAVFEDFFRGTNRAEVPLESSGMGLSIAQRIARLLKGEISLRSDGGGGSRFRFEFPYEYRDNGTRSDVNVPEVARRELASVSDPVAPSHPADAPTDAGLQQLPRCRVLVATDDVTTTMVVEAMVVDQPVEVRSVHDGPSAVRCVGDFRPDVVFLAADLPPSGGLAALDEMRSVCHGDRIAAVALVGQSSVAPAALRAAGFDGLLATPVTKAGLWQALAAHPIGGPLAAELRRRFVARWSAVAELLSNDDILALGTDINAFAVEQDLPILAALTQRLIDACAGFRVDTMQVAFEHLGVVLGIDDGRIASTSPGAADAL